MKRSISLLSAFAFVLAFSGSVFAQAGSSDITASADIISSITFSNEQDLKFGQISDNYTAGDPSIEPASDGNFTLNNTGSGAQGGTMTIDTGSAQSITITIDSPSTLDNEDGNGSIDFGINHIVVDGDGNNEENISSDNGSADITTTENNGNYIANIYFGGSLESQPSDEAGNHTGTITVNVDYQ